MTTSHGAPGSSLGRRRSLQCLAILLAAFGTQAARAADLAPRVLVVPFTVQAGAATPMAAGSSRWLGEAAAMLVTDGLDARGVAVVPRDERVATFDRLQLPLESPLTRATVLRVAELVGASDVVFGEIVSGDPLVVSARLVRVDAAHDLGRVTDQAPAANLFSLFARLTSRLAVETGRPATPPRTAAPEPSLDAFENLAKGFVAATPAASQKLFEAALKTAPHDGRILLALSAAYGAEGAPEKALAAAAAVPADSPLARKARFASAMSLVELRRLDGAFKTLTALSAERPAPAVANALGVVQLRRGSPAGTSAPSVYFRQAVDLDPANPDYLFNLGYAYALSHDQSAALSWLREAVRYDVAMGDAHLVMSEVLAATGRPVEAGRELDLAKDLGVRSEAAVPAVSDAVLPHLERLSPILDVLPHQRLEATIEGPAQRAQEQTASFYLQQGRTLAGEERDHDAIAALRRAVYLSPYDDATHILLGQLYERAGRTADAIDEFKVAIWCRETVDARLALAAALLDSGDRDAARREGERALALDPQSAAAKALLKKIGGADWPSTAC